MKTLHLSDEQINAINPQTIVVAQTLDSGDDILVESLDEIITILREDRKIPADIALDMTNCKALDLWLGDVSGNSNKIIVVQNNSPFQLKMD